MFKKLWKKIKHKAGISRRFPNNGLRNLRGLEPVVVDVQDSQTRASAVISAGSMAAPTEAIKPARSAGGCPSYAAKSVMGQRMTMEDSWQAVPDLLMIPKWWTYNARDHLPPVIARVGDAPADPPLLQPGDNAAGLAQAPAETAAIPDLPEEATPASTDQALDPQQLAATHGTAPVTVHFFAVYDGHGGADVAKHCAKSLHEHLRTVVTASVKLDAAEQPTAASAGPSGSGQAAASPSPDNPPVWPARVEGIEAALKAAFLHTDAQLALTRSAHEVGTTAVVSLVTGRHLWVGNCGDSRALLCREQAAVALSLDHKATRADEVARVEKAGGYVWWDRVMGELAVSRAIGDHCLRPFVIAEPEITSVLRRPEDQLLIMASDGLWDVFTNEEARGLALEKFHGELVRTSSSKMAVKKAASSLAKAALAKGSRDNVTVVVVDVRLQGPAANHHASAAHRAAAPVAAVPATPEAGQGAGSAAAGGVAQAVGAQ